MPLLTQATLGGLDSMIKIALSFALVLSGCVYIQPYPEEWGKRSLHSIAGTYSNAGNIDQESKKLGYNSYNLHRIFWDKPNFNPDHIEIIQDNKNIHVHALENGQIIAKKVYAYKPGEFTIERSGTDKGAVYHDQYRFWKTANGLVVESDSSGVTFFILPLVGGDKTWLLYPEIR